MVYNLGLTRRILRPPLSGIQEYGRNLRMPGTGKLQWSTTEKRAGPQAAETDVKYYIHPSIFYFYEPDITRRAVGQRKRWLGWRKWELQWDETRCSRSPSASWILTWSTRSRSWAGGGDCCRCTRYLSTSGGGGRNGRSEIFTETIILNNSMFVFRQTFHVLIWWKFLSDSSPLSIMTIYLTSFLQKLLLRMR